MAPSHQQSGIILENKGFQKSKLSKMLITPKIGRIFVQKIRFRVSFDFEEVLCRFFLFFCTKIRLVCVVTAHFNLKLILDDLGKEKSNQAELMKS